jgi:hypothetical protein
VLHGALGYAVELSLFPVNPLGQVSWRAPRAAPEVDPRTVPGPSQVQAILAEISQTRPELAAFFACLYYAALRPEEAVALRDNDCVLPPRGLKHRPAGAIRVVPIPPALVTFLQQHLREHGTAPDGRLFRGARGGILSESLYGRAWHAARAAALGPALAATPLARRPCDLRHAGLSLWLAAGAAPAEVTARAGNSIGVLHSACAHCIHGQDEVASQRIGQALRAATGLITAGDGQRPARPPALPGPVRPVSVNRRPAHARPTRRSPGPGQDAPRACQARVVTAGQRIIIEHRRGAGRSRCLAHA